MLHQMKRMGRPLALSFILLSICACSDNSVAQVNPGTAFTRALPAAVSQIMQKPLYAKSRWALLVVDADTREVLYDQGSRQQYQIGSVRKLFSTAVLLNQLSSQYQFRTNLYRTGAVDAQGVLHGDLILVASGDFVMGARRGPNNTVELTEIDHSEANAVGQAIAPTADPLAGYRELAQSVSKAGIRAVDGQVVIDDRLFQPFNFRDQFQANPVFVNDNLIDVQMSPTAVGQLAAITVSPVTASFPVNSTVTTVDGTGLPDVQLAPNSNLSPAQVGGQVSGKLPVRGGSPITNNYPYLQTFRILDPSSHARTVLIEQLRNEGVQVTAATVAGNPSQRLPARNSYQDGQRVAQLTSLPLSQYIRYILKVSYNLGADTALMLFGTTQGVETMADSLRVEGQRLERDFKIAPSSYQFVDGSGGGDSKATPDAVVSLLLGMQGSPEFATFRDGLPVTGAKGIISSVPQIDNDPTLVGSIGQVLAKTGTFATGEPDGIHLKARALAGYITSKSGRRLSFMLVVNDVGPFQEFLQSIEVNHDLDLITALLWREL